jgi:hypothetical protein
MTESDAADNTFMRKSVKKINIKDPRHSWIEDGEPIF